MKKECNDLKNKILEHWKNFYFYAWITFWLFLFIKLKFIYIYIFFFFIIHARIFSIVFFKHGFLLMNEKRKLRLLYSYYVINVLHALGNSKFHYNVILNCIFFFFFKFITGVGFKIFKIIVSSFNSLYKEYHYSRINTKKKSWKIISTMIKNASYVFIYDEFVKFFPTLPSNQVIIVIKTRTVKIRIINSNHWFY